MILSGELGGEVRVSLGSTNGMRGRRARVRMGGAASKKQKGQAGAPKNPWLIEEDQCGEEDLGSADRSEEDRRKDS